VFAVVGAWSFLTSHIYWPFGVATMVMLGLGHTALAVAGARRPAAPHRHAATPDAGHAVAAP